MPKGPNKHGGRGVKYSASVIRKALSLNNKNKRLPKDKRLTYQEIATKCGVRSKQTIANWIRCKKRGDDPSKKVQQHPKNRLLTEYEETVVAGYITARSLNFFSTNTVYVRLFMQEHFGINPHQSWISRWAKRNHLSWKAVQRRNTNRKLSHVRHEIKTFLQELHNLNKERHQIVCIDKSYVQTQQLQTRELAPRGRSVSP